MKVKVQAVGFHRSSEIAVQMLREEEFRNSTELATMVAHLNGADNVVRSGRYTPSWVDRKMSRRTYRSRDAAAKDMLKDAVSELRAVGLLPPVWAILQWALISLAKRFLLNWILAHLTDSDEE